MAAKKTESGKKAGSISKSALINAVVETTGDVSRKQVKAILDAIAEVAYKELKKVGVFTMPGFAKFRVVKKPATKARQGSTPSPSSRRPSPPSRPANRCGRGRSRRQRRDAVMPAERLG